MKQEQQWTKTGPQVTARDVAAVEASLKHTLPNDYVAFVRKHNGGVPSLAIFPIKGMPLNPTGEIRCMLSVGHRLSFCNLVKTNNLLGDAIPADSISIGDTASGGQILLYTRGARAGEVWFYDWYSPYQDPNERVYFIAPSFKDFLNALRELTAEELQEIEDLVGTHILEPAKRKKKKVTKRQSAKPSKTVRKPAPAAKKRRAPPKKP